MPSSLLDLVLSQDDSDGFDMESDILLGKGDHSVIHFRVTLGKQRPVNIKTTRLYHKVDTTTVLDYSNTLDWFPHDKYYPPASSRTTFWALASVTFKQNVN